MTVTALTSVAATLQTAADTTQLHPRASAFRCMVGKGQGQVDHSLQAEAQQYTHTEEGRHCRHLEHELPTLPQDSNCGMKSFKEAMDGMIYVSHSNVQGVQATPATDGTTVVSNWAKEIWRFRARVHMWYYQNLWLLGVTVHARRLQAST